MISKTPVTANDAAQDREARMRFMRISVPLFRQSPSNR